MPLQDNGLVVIDENDIGKSDIEIMMDLIYETNRLRIPEDHIKYGVPTVLDQRPDIATDENTFISVKIDPDYDNRYAAVEGFLYRRVELGAYFENIDITITATAFPFTIRSIWDTQVQPFLPFPIDKKDVEDYLFTSLTATTVNVNGAAGSLLWCGTVKITLNPISPAFFELCPVTQSLPGFSEYTTSV